MMRYRRWLPLRTPAVDRCPRTAVFQSEALCAALGAPNLWLAFNGYWPERGAHMPTGTFKDLESAAVLARFPGNERVLVTASAGNTAAALASAASASGTRAVIVIPQNALPKLRFSRPLAACVRIVVVPGDASYDDAIAFAKSLAQHDPAYAFEGGATNVARRDGIGTTMLAVVEKLHRTPDYFVQAIGSGAGAIAAHEAALRLREAGVAAGAVPSLLLVQNAPSAPVYESWKRRSPALIGYDDREDALRARVRSLAAPVLSTQLPPYAVTGGLYDALCESGGDVCVADNRAAREAGEFFARLEGVTLEPASAVALAGLRAAIAAGELERESCIVLHVTGAGKVPNTVYVPGSVELAA
jgi:cysteate synthase